MKKISLLFFANAIAINFTLSQGTAINATGAPSDNSAMLDVSSTSKGTLLTRLTTVQRNSIASPAQSLLIFNITTQCFEYFDNGIWQTMFCSCSPPPAPISTAGSGATSTQITANWNAAPGAAGYYLDVSDDDSFTSFVSGCQNLNVSNVTAYDVTGLSCGTDYYYRVRAYNTCGTSSNSDTVTYATSGCFTICGASTAIVDVINPATGKTWMDRNLGASRQATASDDYLAYGALFQWGRLSDGHECINWTNSTSGTVVNGTTTTLSSTDVPANSLFIISSTVYDWRSPVNDTRWQTLNGNNNPCPSGYRLPTASETNAEKASWSPANSAGAYASPPKFVIAGRRNGNDGLLSYTGDIGYYWNSTVTYSGFANSIRFSSSGIWTEDGSYRIYGMSVRCIKN